MNGLNRSAINVNDMDNLLGKVKLIDIREPYEVRFGTLQGAENIPMSQLLDCPEGYLNKEEEYYIMCQSGARSARTVSMLGAMGYKVINVGGGMGSYRGTRIK